MRTISLTIPRRAQKKDNLLLDRKQYCKQQSQMRKVFIIQQAQHRNKSTPRLLRFTMPASPLRLTQS